NVDTVSLPANVSSVVNVSAVNMQFVDGQVTLGFGTSDISVRRVWVQSPTHLIANVVVAPGAAINPSEISVISGFQAVWQANSFYPQPANPSIPSIGLPLANADPTQSTLYSGAVVSMYGSNLGPSSAAIQLTLNDQPVQILFASTAQINFVIPSNFPTGVAILKLNNGSAAAPPIAVEIDNPPAASAS
ncbi:MAG TPA: IPT/TIG domain-containing protein, partial [Terriglobales bacterium]|nr:IPT/TIG domain-containing protein [Terriglobales bacterium]